LRDIEEHCKNHPILMADGRCATCWGYFCDACLDDIGDRRYCEDCAAAARRKVEDAETVVEKAERTKLDLRLLLYALIIMLIVVVGGSIITFNGGIDQFFTSYVANYQTATKAQTLGTKLSSFKLLKTDHFNVYYHSADLADAISRPLEDRFQSILGDLLIYQKDVMNRGKFNLIIVADDAELKTLFSDVLPNRVAMTDYATKSIVIVEANETGNVMIDVTHELTHAIFFERMTSGNKIPQWMHEGLASFEEAKYNSAAVDTRWATYGADIAQGGGQPLADMAAVKSDATPAEVNLFYAESQSAVAYLINNYGMLKFMRLATRLQAGRDMDSSIKAIYGPAMLTLNDLQTKWLASLK
jgi:hypothetical protein